MQDTTAPDLFTYRGRLQLAMKEAGLSTSKLSHRMKCTYQGVKKVLDGSSRGFNTENHAAAVRILKVRSEWLAQGEGPMRPDQGEAPSKSVDQASAPGVNLSGMAIELGQLFDMLVDRMDRANAYREASQAILAALKKEGAASQR